MAKTTKKNIILLNVLLMSLSMGCNYQHETLVRKKIQSDPFQIDESKPEVKILLTLKIQPSILDEAGVATLFFQGFFEQAASCNKTPQTAQKIQTSFVNLVDPQKIFDCENQQCQPSVSNSILSTSIPIENCTKGEICTFNYGAIAKLNIPSYTESSECQRFEGNFEATIEIVGLGEGNYSEDNLDVHIAIVDK